MKRPWWRGDLAAGILWAAIKAGAFALTVLLRTVAWEDRPVLAAFIQALLVYAGGDVLAHWAYDWVRYGNT